jgi:D-3-phosphoglycerate dehydrogenase
MGPWIKLAEHLGAFVGQMTDEPIKAINILYDGVWRDEPQGAELRVIAGIMKAPTPT